MMIIATREYRDLTIEVRYDVHPVDPREEFDNYSEEEVRAYLDGDVYGFIISDDTSDHLDSCWGFYGDPDYCLATAVEAADHIADARDQHAAYAAAIEHLAY